MRKKMIVNFLCSFILVAAFFIAGSINEGTSVVWAAETDEEVYMEEQVYLPYEGATYQLVYAQVEGKNEAHIVDIQGEGSERLQIPAVINDLPITAIGDRTFYECEDFTGVLELPDSITSIGAYAFYGCDGLTGALELPDAVTHIGEYAFAYCDGFTGDLVIGNNVTHIGENAFRYCTGFAGGKLKMSENITSIGDSAFLCCGFSEANFTLGAKKISDNLFGFYYSEDDWETMTFMLKEGVEEIGKSAFSGEDFQGNLVLPQSLKKIGDFAFRSCSGFEGQLMIPEGIESIGEAAFKDCTGFEGELIIPQGVEFIGKDAFRSFGNGFRYVKVLGMTTVIEENAFYGMKFIYGYTGSTAETYAIEKEIPFVPLDTEVEQVPCRVTNAEELKAALGSNKHIILADGIYKMRILYLKGLVNVTMEAEHIGKAEILLDNRDNPVLTMRNCAKITVRGLILGHEWDTKTSEDGCGMHAEVVSTEDSMDIQIEDSDLYGCGYVGISSYIYSARNVVAKDCVIRDCTKNIVDGEFDGIALKDCIISGNGRKVAESMVYGICNDAKRSVIIENCQFFNNNNAGFYNPEVLELEMSGSSFFDNAWDGKTPKAYGICLNGITWQVDNNTLKIGYPLQLDENTVIESSMGEVLNYSLSALPWRLYMNLPLNVAAGVTYDASKYEETSAPEENPSGGNGDNSSSTNNPSQNTGNNENNTNNNNSINNNTGSIGNNNNLQDPSVVTGESKITIYSSSKKLAAGKKVTLTAEITPITAGYHTVTWATSNQEYATIDNDGNLTLKKAGAGKTVTVTATATDGSGETASYTIKIMKHSVKKIGITASSKKIKAGKKLKLKTKIKTTGKNANTSLQWICSNPNYATVSKKGVVKAKPAGKGKYITITAISTDGSRIGTRIRLKIK